MRAVGVCEEEEAGRYVLRPDATVFVSVSLQEHFLKNILHTHV